MIKGYKLTNSFYDDSPQEWGNYPKRKFENKRVKITKIEGMDIYVFNYKWDNGYVQCRIADDSCGNPGDKWEDGTDMFIPLLAQFYDFRRTIQYGMNALYAAYSTLPKEWIDQDTGRPLIEMDFEDADVYLKTGKLPSPEKLTQNEQEKGQMKVNKKAIKELL